MASIRRDIAGNNTIYVCTATGETLLNPDYHSLNGLYDRCRAAGGSVQKRVQTRTTRTSGADGVEESAKTAPATPAPTPKDDKIFGIDKKYVIWGAVIVAGIIVYKKFIK